MRKLLYATGNGLYATGENVGCECVRKILYATGEEEKKKKNISRSGGCDAPAMRFDLLVVFAHYNT